MKDEENADKSKYSIAKVKKARNKALRNEVENQMTEEEKLKEREAANKMLERYDMNQNRILFDKQTITSYFNTQNCNFSECMKSWKTMKNYLGIQVLKMFNLRWICTATNVFFDEINLKNNVPHLYY